MIADMRCTQVFSIVRSVATETNDFAIIIQLTTYLALFRFSLDKADKGLFEYRDRKAPNFGRTR